MNNLPRDVTTFLERFEEDWTPQPVSAVVESIAKSACDRRSELFEETVLLDLEMWWKHRASSDGSAVTVEESRLLEQYFASSTEFAQMPPSMRLITKEFTVRHRWGDEPEIAEYLSRFHEHADIADVLSRVLAELPKRKEPLTRPQTESPVSKLSGEELIALIADCGLVAEDQLQQLRSAERPDTDGILRHVLSERLLTLYQVEQLAEHGPKALVLGEYVIKDKLGEGGMGLVLKAEHRRMKRLVAIKVLPDHAISSERHLKRFHHEIQVLAQLSHPNIVTAFDAGESSGRHFLAMEYVEGRDLREIVHADGPLSVQQAVSYLIDAANGLGYAHQQGIVHRDIKPGNLLLDIDGVVKVLDLGLARMDRDTSAGDQTQLTEQGALMGTAEFIAPEQVEDTHSVDGRADIYSLGATLFYLLAGRPMFRGKSAISTMISHRQDSPPLLRDHRKEIPGLLETVYLKMVAKEPSSRFQTMVSLVDALRTVQSLFGDNGEVARELPVAPVLTASADETPTVVLDPQVKSQSGFPETLKWDESGSSVTHKIELRKQADRFRRMLFVLAGMFITAAGGVYWAYHAMTSTSIQIEWPEKNRNGGAIEVNGVTHALPATGDIQIDGRPGEIELRLSRPGFNNVFQEFNLGAGESRTIKPKWIPSDESVASAAVSDVIDRIEALVKAFDGQVPRNETRLAKLRREWAKFYAQEHPPEIRQSLSKALRLLPAPADSLTADDVPNPERQLASARDQQLDRMLVAVLGDSQLKHWNTVTSCDFSSDGTRLFTGSEDGTVVVREVDSGKRVKSLVMDSEVASLCVSSKGELAVGSGSLVHCWDTNTWKKLRTLDSPVSGPKKLAYSPDGSKLIVASKGISIWSAEQTWRTLTEAGVPHIAISPNGIWLGYVKLATGGVGTLEFYNLETNNSGNTIQPPQDYSEIAFINDETLISASASSRDLTTWNVLTGRREATFEAEIFQFATCPGGSSEIVGWNHGDTRSTVDTAFVFDIQKRERERRLVAPVSLVPRSIQYSRDGSLVVIAGAFGGIYLWETATWKRVGASAGHQCAVNQVRVTPDGTKAITASADGGLTIWDLQTGAKLSSLQNRGPAITEMAISPNGRFVATAGASIDVTLWDLETGTRRTRECVGVSATSIAFMPDGGSIVVSTQTGRVSQWQIRTDELSLDILPTPLKGRIGSQLAVSPDGKSLALAHIHTTDWRISMWSLDGMRLQRTIDTCRPPITYLPNDRFGFEPRFGVYAVFPLSAPETFRESMTKELRVQDRRTPLAFRNGIRATAINPVDGSFAMAYSDGSLRLWNSSLQFDRTIQIGPPGGFIHDIQFTPDGRHLITANGNGTSYVLRLE